MTTPLAPAALPRGHARAPSWPQGASPADRPSRIRGDRLIAALLVAAALLGGCAVQTATLRSAPPADLPLRAELVATPFFPQTEYQCGPAALATALGAAGVAALPEQLAEQIFLPARTGTLQIEMVAGARRQGVVATRIPPTLEAALREVAAGRPVVVLQNLGLSWVPAWHYAVLVGYDLEAGQALLRSGTTEREVLALRTLEHTWTRAGAWSIVLTPPGQWPATALPAAVVEAAVGFERVAAPAQAIAAYRGALQRWPGELSLQMGLGNSRHAGGDRAGAAAAFRAAAHDHPRSVPARINLATTLLDLGDAPGALQAAREAVALDDPTWAERARATLAAVQNASSARR